MDAGSLSSGRALPQGWEAEVYVDEYTMSKIDPSNRRLTGPKRYLRTM
jgi:hypothetical protein